MNTFLNTLIEKENNLTNAIEALNNGRFTTDKNFQAMLRKVSKARKELEQARIAWTSNLGD